MHLYPDIKIIYKGSNFHGSSIKTNYLIECLYYKEDKIISIANENKSTIEYIFSISIATPGKGADFGLHNSSTV